MEGPFRMPDDTVVTDDLAREQAYLENARRELARMREKTLSARASGGDRVSDEVLAIPVHPMLSRNDLATIVDAVRAVATPAERA